MQKLKWGRRWLAAVMILLVLAIGFGVVYRCCFFLDLDRVSRIEVRIYPDNTGRHVGQVTVSDPAAFAALQSGLKRMKRLGGVDSSLNALPWRIDVIYVFTDGTERTVRLDGNRDHQAVEAWEQSLLGEGWIDG